MAVNPSLTHAFETSRSQVCKARVQPKAGPAADVNNTINMSEELFVNLLLAGQEARNRGQHRVVADRLGRKSLVHSSRMDKQRHRGSWTDHDDEVTSNKSVCTSVTASTCSPSSGECSISIPLSPASLKSPASSRAPEQQRQCALLRLLCEVFCMFFCWICSLSSIPDKLANGAYAYSSKCLGQTRCNSSSRKSSGWRLSASWENARSQLL
jgi:hypothetical protein